MFYDNLTKLCIDKNIKISTLISELGMSSGNLSKWKGGTSPNGDTLLKFAEYFNVSTDYLLTGEEKIIKKEEENISIEQLAKQEGITDEEYIKSLKSIFDLMKKNGYNTELADEFISKEYSKK